MRKVSGLPRTIGDDVRRELGRFPLTGAMAKIVEEWPAAVGDAVAANAWPRRLARDGTLHVATSSSAWAFELTRCGEVVRVRLAARLGEGVPRSLRFAAGALPERSAESVKTSAWTVPNVREEHRVEGERIAREIGDSELRELVAKAVAASLAARSLERSDRPF